MKRLPKAILRPKVGRPYGAEKYFVLDGELCRTFARHPGTQVHRNSVWGWR